MEGEVDDLHVQSSCFFPASADQPETIINYIAWKYSKSTRDLAPGLFLERVSIKRSQSAQVITVQMGFVRFQRSALENNFFRNCQRNSGKNCVSVVVFLPASPHFLKPSHGWSIEMVHQRETFGRTNQGLKWSRVTGLEQCWSREDPTEIYRNLPRYNTLPLSDSLGVFSWFSR